MQISMVGLPFLESITDKLRFGRSSGLLVSTLSSHAAMASHSDVIYWASTILSLQQRDCAGLSPASLLASTTGDQIGGKNTKKLH